MVRIALKKERWTLTFDQDLKNLVQQEAFKLRIYPVQLLETMVRQNLNPYGLTSIKNSIAYVNSVRKKNKTLSDKTFIKDMKKWQKQSF